MKIVKHITFFYIEDRIIYINNIINEVNNYEYETDIFIHTNINNFEIDKLSKYNNGLIKIIYHNLSNCHPHKLTWKSREIIKTQKDKYDIFIYLEDDILIKFNTIKYWIKFNKKTIENNYNLGFLRIEVKDKDEYITDLLKDKKFKHNIKIDNQNYCINNINPYCAFWIYSKEELNKFINTDYYDFKNPKQNYYYTRERSAIGLHGINFNYYKGTIIPIENNKLHEDCKVYHMPNNYVNNEKGVFCKVKFDNCLNFKN